MRPDPDRAVAGAASDGWHARLALRFASRGGATRLVHNRHFGPLRLIRALPAAGGRCDAVIVHPPGGLVGGDRLELEVALGDAARVLCTTPGAQKWYRTRAAAAHAHTRVTLAAGAELEWLPQPAIVYDAARVEQTIDFALAPDARMVGWECLVLGRTAMGERFTRGALRQRLTIAVDGVPAWSEHLAAAAGDRVFVSPLGWAGRVVGGTVWAVAPAGALDDALLDAWRAIVAAAADAADGRSARLEAGASRTAPGLLAARLLADDAEVAMRVAQSLWARARSALLGGAGDVPRIWAT